MNPANPRPWRWRVLRRGNPGHPGGRGQSRKSPR